jgi:predicted esterase
MTGAPQRTRRARDVKQEMHPPSEIDVRDRARRYSHGVRLALVMMFAACGAPTARAPAGAPTAPAPAPAAAPAQQRAACADAVVLALVGSGQNVKSPSDLSVSPQLRAVYEATAAHVGAARSLTVHVVDYPAESVNVLFAGVTVHDVETRLRDNIREYLAGEKQGVKALLLELAATHAECPRTAIALIGYSQGAMVVHDVLGELASHRIAARDAIVGAVLLADPERVAHAAPVELGTAHADTHGVCASVRHLVSCTAPAELADVPAPFVALTASVCDRGDAVCDTSELFGELLHHPTPARAKELIHAGATIHHAYADRPETASAGEWLARRILAAPR